MSKFKVFISHSAKEPQAKETLTKLEEALSEAGYLVLVDKEQLKLGYNWRSTLNLWICCCDAAIVLLSESALKSDWVAYETTLLACRMRFESNFKLIPILIPPIDRNAVKQSGLSPTRIDDIQWVTQHILLDQAIPHVLEALRNLEQQKTPLETPAQHLRYLLKEVPKEQVEWAANQLGIDLRIWVPLSDLKMALALKMLGAGLEKSEQTIRENIDPYLPDFASLVEMIDLVASSWVDYRSTQKIPEAARTGKSIGVNGENPLTAKMYVIRACPIRPSRMWCVVQADGVRGEDTKDLVDGICSSLSQALKTDDDIEEVKKELKKRMRREPVFVVLPSRGIDGKELEALREKFPGVTFFLLTGSGPPPAEKDLEEANVVFLRPELKSHEEEEYLCTQYEDSRDYLISERKRVHDA